MDFSEISTGKKVVIGIIVLFCVSIIIVALSGFFSFDVNTNVNSNNNINLNDINNSDNINSSKVVLRITFDGSISGVYNITDNDYISTQSVIYTSNYETVKIFDVSNNTNVSINGIIKQNNGKIFKIELIKEGKVVKVFEAENNEIKIVV